MIDIRRTTVTALTMAVLLAACDKGSDTEAKPTPAAADTKTDAPKTDGPAVAKADDGGKPVVPEADDAADPKADAAPKADADPAEATPTDAAPTDPAPTDAAPVVAEPGKPGPAYFAVRDKGVVMLDGGKFTTIAGSPDKLVREIEPGPDGGVYLLGFEGISRLDGAKLSMVAATGLGDSTGSLEDMAVTKDGEFWAVGYKGVSHFSGGAWTTEDKTVLGSDVTLLRSVAVDGQGRVWVTSANALHVRDGETWSTVDISKQFKRQAFFEGVATGPEGIVYAIASSQMIKVSAPDSIETVKIAKGFAMLSNLQFSSLGVGGLETGIDVVTRLADDGTKTNFKAGKDFAADRIEDVTPDDSGRLWIATDAGVAIVGPAAERVEWKSGSIDELAGQVEVIGVVGSGPELPSEVGPVKTGGLKGKILKGGAGVAGTEVEICPKPNSFFRKSPCAESPTRRSATTDAEGNFQIDDVPLGAYGLAVKVGSKWQLTFGSEYGSGMKEGAVYDIGSVTLNDE